MPRTVYDGRSRGRGNFLDDLDDEDEISFLDHNERVVRMEGDSLTAGTKPRIYFKSRVRLNQNRCSDLAIQKYVKDDMKMTLHNKNEYNEFETRQVVIRGRGRGPIYSRFGSPGSNSRQDLRDRLTQVVLADANWYKVVIPWGQNFDKDLIINSILSHIAPATFVPILYTLQEKSSSFFVDDSDIAKKLLNCNGKIRLNKHFILHVYVKPGYPQCEINDALKDRLAQAMTKRYSVEMNSLDLSKFHQDLDLANDYFCALFQPFVLMEVLDIVTKHIPNLHALNLEGNKFHSIDRLSSLNTRFLNLKILYLGDNNLKDINQIECIKDLKLEELRLSGNPLCCKYIQRENEYVSDVRQRFPKLLRLDTIELPPPILFDVVEDGLKIPPSKSSFTFKEESKHIAGQFFQQYYSIFDNDSRQNLLNAYHEKASFSMTVSSGLLARQNGYLGESRNLLRLSDPNRRRKLLRIGRLSVLSAISEIPRTKHYLNSFTMDLSFCTDTMIVVTVTGLYKEIETTETPLRYFNRVFAIVPEGEGYCILNEQLHISSPTKLQYQRIIENQKIEAEVSTSAMPLEIPKLVTTESNSQNTLIEAPNMTEEIKQEMLANLSQESNMNISWSYKCLEEVQWNYDKARAAFQTCFQEGRIPAEAFVK